MIIDALSWICLLAGGLVGIIGAVGIHRFPDFYSRQHATGITDTLCAMLILFGLGLQAGMSLAAFKIAMIFLFLFLTSPTATHALANAAMHSGLRPKLDSITGEGKS
ncbi:MAG: monovalent cation/H(+) antiporter subunit G [Hyphomicrobiaceae bacterium]|nr:monovalent cation/H(+) antiporter subunit G [Hyphomicrobiaceae bacterium]